jgi:cupin 2 domain-containing protein
MLFNFLQNLPKLQNGEEIFEVIAESESFIIERIVSNNAVSPSEGWFDQPHDEWVMVIQGSGIIQTEERDIELYNGDTFFIPAHTKHKVIFTSTVPVCVWLAVHEKK